MLIPVQLLCMKKLAFLAIIVLNFSVELDLSELSQNFSSWGLWNRPRERQTMWLGWLGVAADVGSNCMWGGCWCWLHLYMGWLLKLAPHVRGVAADVGSTSLVEYDCVDKLSYGIHGAAWCEDGCIGDMTWCIYTC